MKLGRILYQFPNGIKSNQVNYYQLKAGSLTDCGGLNRRLKDDAPKGGGLHHLRRLRRAKAAFGESTWVGAPTKTSSISLTLSSSRYSPTKLPWSVSRSS